jgi:hypothetical protein
MILGVALLILALALGGCAAPRSPLSGASGGVGGGPAGDFAAEMPAEPAMVEVEFSAGADSAESAARSGETASDVAVANAQTGGEQIERLIIRTGFISMAVEDTRGARIQIEGIVNQYTGAGAFVVSSSESGGGEQPYITMQVRVPSEHFDAVMDSIADLGIDVYDRSESGQDVTEEYVDLQARLESLEAARDRLLDIIRDAQTTEDLLLAEQQLTQREAEIESIKGRLQYLSQSARLSSISINLQPYILSQPVDTTWKPAITFRRAIDNLIDGIQGFADFLIIFVISVLPWLVLFGLVIYGSGRFVWGRIQKGMNKRKAAGSSSGSGDEN